MRFTSRDEFINAQASEKLTLVHVHCKQRLYVFSGPSSNIYSKQVPYFVYELKQNDLLFTRVSSLSNLLYDGQFYYDIKTSTLYIKTFGNVSPVSVEIIVTYRLFFSNTGLTCTWDLQNISDEVFYDGRIKQSPGYKHKIGIDQALTSLVGTGNLTLFASDGELNAIFDKMIFENQKVIVYSWNRDLNPSDARVIYRGKITNKTFNNEEISFTVKDPIFELLQPPQNSVYSDSDNVSDSIKGQYKRLIYGRVDGLKCQSISQIKTGFQLTGTLSASVSAAKLYGTGTQFFSEVLQGDEIIVDTQRFTVDKIISNTELDISDEPDYGFAGLNAFNKPKRGVSFKNRVYLASGHVCTEQVKSIISVNQLNRIKLDNTDGLYPGDFVEFQSTGERLEIKNTAPGNILVLRQNMINRPTLGSTLIRRPIQKVYLNGKIVPSNKFTINNTTGCGLTFTQDVEFSIAPEKNTPFQLNFTNGSNIVTYTNGGEIQVAETLSAGDWIKPNSPTYTTYFKISYINNNNIYLTQPFSDLTVSSIDADYKSPEYIEDDTIVSCDILGKTENGLSNGTWISTVSQAQKDLLTQIGITDLNIQSFVDGQIDGNQLISIAIPENFSSKTIPKTKDIVDKLNKSISSSLTLDVDLNIKFQVLNAYSGEELKVISDNDVIDWNIKSSNGKIYNKIISKYRFKDVSNDTLEEGNNLFTYESEFVNRYIESGQLNEVSLYLYNEFEAKISSHRNLYQNRLSVSTINIKSDLRLENIEIGDVVILNFDKMFTRIGDTSSKKKTALVTGKTVSGESIDLELSDLGNTLSTSSFITPNDAPDYSLASEDQKLIYGYITDNQGIINNIEDTANVHLIS